jgi:predicted dehydrogenase
MWKKTWRPSDSPAPPTEAASSQGVALVGFGPHMLSCLLPALRLLEIPVACVISRHPQAVREQARRLGIPHSLEGIEALASIEGVRAVIMAVNAAAHPELIRALAPAGLPLFVEKPLARTVAELQALTDQLGDAAGPLMVGMQKRFAPAYLQAKRLIDEQRLGALTQAHYRLHTGPLGGPQGGPQGGADFLLEVGIHALDLLLHLMGPLELIGARSVRRDNRLSVTALLASESGATATLQMGELGGWRQLNERLELFGVGHQLTIDNLVDVQWQRPAAATGESLLGSTDEHLSQLPNFTVPVRENNSLVLQGYVGELEHFFSKLDESQAPSPGIEEAMRSLALLESIRAEAG